MNRLGDISQIIGLCCKNDLRTYNLSLLPLVVQQFQKFEIRILPRHPCNKPLIIHCLRSIMGVGNTSPYDLVFPQNRSDRTLYWLEIYGTRASWCRCCTSKCSRNQAGLEPIMNNQAKIPELEARKQHITNVQAACQQLEAFTSALNELIAQIKVAIHCQPRISLKDQPITGTEAGSTSHSKS